MAKERGSIPQQARSFVLVNPYIYGCKYGIRRQAQKAFHFVSKYWLEQEGPYRSHQKDCALVKCRHVVVCKHMTVNVFVIFHIDSNFPLWTIKVKSTSSRRSDKRACSGPLALGNGEVTSCASVLHSNRIHDKCLFCRDLSVLQSI